ncbi:hypothetical protein EON65_19655, partial [archaeon]
YPTGQPSSQPSSLPSGQPSSKPTCQPTGQPTCVPTSQPSTQPTCVPTSQPSTQPTGQPSAIPTSQPSGQPTTQPTQQPTSFPTGQPSVQPSTQPTGEPTGQPTQQPTSQPSAQPSMQPSSQPSSQPSVSPTAQPSSQPSDQPTTQPSRQPSVQPSSQPSMQPSCEPSSQPSSQPTRQPSCQPSSQPTFQPSRQPSSQPSCQPSRQPSFQPSRQPSNQPSTQPTSQPSAQPSRQPTLQPSSQPSSVPTTSKPSGQPSHQPSSQPSGQPTSSPTTSKPSSEPSSCPTLAPATSMPTEPGKTNRPTLQPTSRPTFNVFDYASTELYNRYSNLLTSIAPVSNKVFYSTLYYKGTRPIGSCESWSRFASIDSRLPGDDIYFPTLTLNGGKYDYGSAESGYYSYTCNNPSIIKTMISSLNNRESFDGICNNIRFKIQNCSTGMSICANCKAICRSNWCGRSVLDGAVTFEPCSPSCSSRKGLYDVLDLRFDYVIYYPEISSSLSIKSNRTSLTVSANVTASGTIFCYAAPPSNANVTSVFTVKTMGTSQTILQPGIVIVTIGDLEPSTRYTIFCYTEDFAGHVMSLSTVLNTRKVASTLCCSEVSFLSTVAFQPAVRNATSSGAGGLSPFTFRLSASSTRNYTVALRATWVQSGCTVSPLVPQPRALLQPSNFTIDGNRLNDIRSFRIYGDAACYTIQAALFNTTVRSLLIASNLISNTSIQVALTATAVQASELLLARYNNDGLGMIIEFDTSTDQATIILGSSTTFTCGVVFDFLGASNSTCTWSSNKLVSVAFSRADSAVSFASVGDSVKIRSNRVRSAFCSSLPASNENCLFSSASVVVTIQSPISPIIPVVSISAPSMIGSCDNLFLDCTNSYNRGVRPWRAITWTVSYIHPNGTLNPYIGQTLGTFMNNNEATVDRQITISKSRLFAGTYTFVLQLTSSLNATRQASAIVVVSTSNSIPQVRIGGPRVLNIMRANPVTLVASATLSSCDSSENRRLTYIWSVFKDSAFVPSVVSTSGDAKIFSINAFTLNVSSSYQVQVTVRTSTGVVNSASVRIVVGVNRPVALIRGGSIQRQSALTNFVLDGTSSYSSDYPGDISKLKFFWLCTELTSTYFGLPCQNIALSSAPSMVLDMTAYASSTETRTLQFFMSVSTVDNLSANVSTVLELYPLKTSPLVSIQPVRSKLNNDDKITVTGTIDSTLFCRTSWTVTNLLAAEDVLFMTPQTRQLSAGYRVIQQAIPAFAFREGAIYTLRLSALFINDGFNNFTSFAEILLSINAPPGGGSLVVSPNAGIALNTTFSVQTFSWTDAPEDLPLTYTMDYYINIFSIPQLLKQRNTLTFFSGLLGAGLLEYSYNATIVARAFDNLGASGNVSIDNVRVSPAAISSSTLRGVASDLLSSSTTADGNTKDASYTTQVISAVNNYINVVNCSLVSTSFCAQRNRKPCSLVPQTCGKCFNNFVGPDSQNTACTRPGNSGSGGNSRYDYSGVDNTVLAQPITCISNDECSSNSCLNNVCTDTHKVCPNDCNGHGSCVYVDFSNTPISECLNSDPFCRATCHCHPDYYGQFCLLSLEDFQNYALIRKEMCISLRNSLPTLDNNLDTVRNSANVIASIFADPTQVDDEALDACTNALVDIADNHSALVYSSSVYSSFIFAIDSVLSSANGNTSFFISTRESLASLTSQILGNMQTDSALGETAAYGLYDELRFMSLVLDARNSLSDEFDVRLPATAYEDENNFDPQLTSNLVSVLYNQSSFETGEGLGVSAFVSTNSLNGFRLSTAPMITFQVGKQVRTLSDNTLTTFSSRRRYLQSSASDGNYSLLFTFNTFEHTNYYVTSPDRNLVECKKHYYNYTLYKDCGQGVVIPFYCPGDIGIIYNYTCPQYSLTPFCYEFDSSIQQFNKSSASNACYVYSGNPQNVTCRCDYDPATVPTFRKDTRLTRFDSTDALDEQSRLLQDASAGARTITIATEFLVTPFVRVVVYTDEAVDLTLNPDIIIFINALFFTVIFAFGLVLCCYRDSHVRKPSSTVAKGSKTTASTSIWYKITHSLQLHSAQSLIRSDQLLVKNFFYPIVKEDEVQESFVYSGALSNVYNSQMKQNKYVLSINFLMNSVLPVEYTALSVGKIIMHKFFQEVDVLYYINQLFKLHNYDISLSIVNPMYHQNSHNLIRYPEYVKHYVNWILTFSRFVNMMFITFLVIYYFFNDDKECEKLTSQNDCEAVKTLFEMDNRCVWDPTVHTACIYNIEPINNVLINYIVIIIVLAETFLYEHLFKYVLVQILLYHHRQRYISSVNITKARNKKIIPVKASSSGIHQSKSPVQSKTNARATTKTGSKGKAQGNNTRNSQNSGPKPTIAVVPVVKTDTFAESLVRSNLNNITYKVTPSYELRALHSHATNKRSKYMQAARLYIMTNKYDKLNSFFEALYLHKNYGHKDISRIMQLSVWDYLRSATYSPNFLYMFNRDKKYYSSEHYDVHSTAAINRDDCNANGDTGAITFPSQSVDHSKEATYSVLAIMYFIKNLKAELKEIKSNLYYLDRDLDRDTYLAQLFLIDLLPKFYKQVARLNFFSAFHTMNDSQYYNIYVLYSLFWFMLGYLIFSLAFVLTYAFDIGAKATINWFAIVYISIGAYYILLKPIAIYFKYIVTPYVMKTELLLYHYLFKQQLPTILGRRYGMLKGLTSSGLVQHLSVVRAAHANPDLPMSRALINLNDNDIHYLKNTTPYRTYVQAFARYLCLAIVCGIYAPVFLLFPAYLQSFGLELCIHLLVFGIAYGILYTHMYVNSFIAIAMGVGLVMACALPPVFFFSRVLYTKYQTSMKKISPIDAEKSEVVAGENEGENDVFSSPKKEFDLELDSQVNSKVQTKSSNPKNIQIITFSPPTSPGKDFNMTSIKFDDEQNKIILNHHDAHGGVLSSFEEQYLYAQRMEMYYTSIIIVKGKTRQTVTVYEYYNDKHRTYMEKTAAYKKRRGFGHSKPKMGKLAGILDAVQGTTRQRRRMLEAQNRLHDEMAHMTSSIDDIKDHFDFSGDQEKKEKITKDIELHFSEKEKAVDEQMKQLRRNIWGSSSSSKGHIQTTGRILSKRAVGLQNIYVPRAYKRLQRMKEQLRQEKEDQLKERLEEEHFDYDFAQDYVDIIP